MPFIAGQSEEIGEVARVLARASANPAVKLFLLPCLKGLFSDDRVKQLEALRDLEGGASLAGRYHEELLIACASVRKAMELK